LYPKIKANFKLKSKDMRQSLLLILFLFPSSLIWSQEYDFSRSWSSLGPDKKPLEDSFQSANGIGPIEFISPNRKNKGWYLVGALNGGLFYTENGGEQWLSAGSDLWDYTTCSWADYHPIKEKTWFAYSHLEGNNGKPGRIGNLGGIYRTMDAGENWELIADLEVFDNSEWCVVHGFQFHPENPNHMFVYTTLGMYQTFDCTADEVKWTKVNGPLGNIFDMEFVNDKVYYSQDANGKWSLIESSSTDLSKSKRLTFIEDDQDQKEGITLEPRGDDLLALVNYSKKPDELWNYDPNTEESEAVVKMLRIVFGSGRTFDVNPFNPDDAIVGFSLQMKRFDLTTGKTNPLRSSGYHVDIENVCYDPFDSTVIYIATHGGIYKSEDNGDSWYSQSKGLGVAEVEGIAVSGADPDVITIGCFHDGSSLRRNWKESYEWKNINGGDGLIPLLPKDSNGYVYTSNQYRGGGLYVSTDWGKTKRNLHYYNKVVSSGWQMATVLHPDNNDVLFFNYAHKNSAIIDVARTDNVLKPDSMERLTDFKSSHELEKYSVYGIYNSAYYPNHLYVHVIHMTKNENGDPINVHRLYKTENCLAPAEEVINSWVELELPRNEWIANVTPDPDKSNRLYVAFVSGIWGAEGTYEDFGLIYQLKLSKTNSVKRTIDISNNLPYSQTGRYNLTPDGKGGMFFGTRTGIYYGNKKTLKGRRGWKKIGRNTPHCKVHGLYYDKKTNTLTVGYFGRGVWRYYL
jgi:hypothetical protein